jgi:hypothetical protein
VICADGFILSSVYVKRIRNTTGVGILSIYYFFLVLYDSVFVPESKSSLHRLLGVPLIFLPAGILHYLEPPFL